MFYPIACLDEKINANVLLLDFNSSQNILQKGLSEYFVEIARLTNHLRCLEYTSSFTSQMLLDIPMQFSSTYLHLQFEVLPEIDPPYKKHLCL